MLEAIGVAERLEGVTCPIRAIRVSDGLEARRHRCSIPEARTTRSASWSRTGCSARRLRDAARGGGADRAADAGPARPRWCATRAGVRVALDDGRLLAAPLLVGAEGRNSPTREAAGIPIARWRYDHVAIVATVAHERPHGEHRL